MNEKKLSTGIMSSHPRYDELILKPGSNPTGSVVISNDFVLPAEKVTPELVEALRVIKGMSDYQKIEPIRPLPPSNGSEFERALLFVACRKLKLTYTYKNWRFADYNVKGNAALILTILRSLEEYLKTKSSFSVDVWREMQEFASLVDKDFLLCLVVNMSHMLHRITFKDTSLVGQWVEYNKKHPELTFRSSRKTFTFVFSVAYASLPWIREKSNKKKPKWLRRVMVDDKVHDNMSSLKLSAEFFNPNPYGWELLGGEVHLSQEDVADIIRGLKLHSTPLEEGQAFEAYQRLSDHGFETVFAFFLQKYPLASREEMEATLRRHQVSQERPIERARIDPSPTKPRRKLKRENSVFFAKTSDEDHSEDGPASWSKMPYSAFSAQLELDPQSLMSQVVKRLEGNPEHLFRFNGLSSSDLTGTMMSTTHSICAQWVSHCLKSIGIMVEAGSLVKKANSLAFLALVMDLAIKGVAPEDGELDHYVELDGCWVGPTERSSRTLTTYRVNGRGVFEMPRDTLRQKEGHSAYYL